MSGVLQRLVACVLALSGLLAIGGCSSPLAAGDITTSLDTEFSSKALPAFAVSISGRTVAITGGITTGFACVTFSRTIAASGSMLVATITTTDSPVACIGILGQFAYTLTLGNVPRGTWGLRIDHRISNRGNETAYETTITVR